MQTESVIHQLVGDLNAMAKQAQNRLRWQAVFSCFLTVLAVAAVLLVIDCLLQREEVGLRWLFWTILLVASMLAAYRWWVPVWNTRVRPMDIALWMEKRQPELTGRLSTALELAEIDLADARFGSQSFRQAALLQWELNPAKPRWEDLFSNQRLKKAAALLAAIVIGLITLLACAPDLGIHALRRMFIPWSNESWPRADQLEFVNIPNAVGPESTIQLEIRDRRPPLPEDVSIELRYASTAESVVSILAQQVADLAVASLPPIVEEIEVRAVGGDDRQMPWQTIRVVELPSWKAYKFQIQPPDYIRQSPAALLRLTTAPLNEAGAYELVGQRISVLSGSRLRFDGELTSPIRDIFAQPFFADTAANRKTEESKKDPLAQLPWLLKLDRNQTSVLSFAVNGPNTANHTGVTAEGERFATFEKSVAWTFRMETADQVILDAPQHWKIDVVPDNAPEAMMETPVLRTLTVGAPLILRAQARDDWGLRSLIAKLSISSHPETEYELPIELGSGAPTVHSIRQEWAFSSQLASSNIEIKPQDQITIWVEAVDLSGKRTKSNVEKITLESKQRQLESIANRQNSMVDQIAELLSAQESARELAKRTASDLQQQTPTQQHLDAISSVKQLQQSIYQQLVDSPQSLRVEIDRLQQLVLENEVNDTPFAQQLQLLKQKVDEIGEGAASSALQTAGVLQNEIAAAMGSGDKSQLTKVEVELGLHQSNALSQLQELINKLEDASSIDRLREKLVEIAQQHERLAEDSAQLNVESLGKPKSDFEERLTAATQLQVELTSQVELWLTAVLQLNDDQPGQTLERQADQLLQAAQVMSDSQVVGLMRSASADLRLEQLGPATQTQKRVQLAILAALDKLGQSTVSELMDSLTTQEQQFRMLQDQAGRLAQQQMQLSEDLSAPQANLKHQQLAESQNRISRETARILDELDGADAISEKIRQTQQLQQRASQAAENQSMREAAELAAQAAKQLNEVASALEQKADRANQQVIQQQMYELANALDQVITDQQAIMPSYDQLAQDSIDLSSELVIQSRSLIQKQVAVRESLRRLSSSTESIHVFHWVLLQAEGDLTRAIASAERNRFKPDAINAAAAGLRKLILASQSLESKSTDSDPANNEPDDSSERQPDDSPEDSEISLPPLASLNLIRSLQLELREQTLALENNPDRQTKLLEITRQQQDLASLLEELVTEAQSQQETNQ